MKNILPILYVITSLVGNSQNVSYKDTTAYIPKKLFKEYMEHSDSLGFRIIDHDTLILIARLPNGVRLKNAVSIPYEYKDEIFLKYYKNIAFRPKHEDSVDTETMKYWKVPIKLFYAKNVDHTIRKEITIFAKTINKNIDSLSIEVVENHEDSNFVIYNNDDFNFETKLNNENAGGYQIYWQNQSQIYKAYIRYNKNRLFGYKTQIFKIKELFIVALGFFNLSDIFSCESVFSNCYSDQKKFSELDWELLKYHYSYGICKGATKFAFEAQHKRAKETLRDTKVIINFIHNN